MNMKLNRSLFLALLSCVALAMENPYTPFFLGMGVKYDEIAVSEKLSKAGLVLSDEVKIVDMSDIDGALKTWNEKHRYSQSNKVKFIKKLDIKKQTKSFEVIIYVVPSTGAICQIEAMGNLAVLDSDPINQKAIALDIIGKVVEAGYDNLHGEVNGKAIAATDVVSTVEGIALDNIKVNLANTIKVTGSGLYTKVKKNSGNFEISITVNSRDTPSEMGIIVRSKDLKLIADADREIGIYVNKVQDRIKEQERTKNKSTSAVGSNKTGL